MGNSLNNLSFKIVYALVSSDMDTYAEQCYISVYSLKIMHPLAEVVLVVDDKTYANLLSDVRKELATMVDEVKVVNFPEDVKPMVRSRQIKTNLRDLISGDFLYLDCDTLIVKDISGLNDILVQEGDIFMVQDCHIPVHLMSTDHIEFHASNAKLIGYDIEKEDYNFFNSGVAIVKDTPASRLLYKTWNETYLINLKKHGIKTDQASLCYSNSVHGHLIKPLHKKYNFQISATLIDVEEACIIHSFATANSETDAIFPLQKNSFYQLLKTDKTKCLGLADQCIQNPINQIDYIAILYDHIVNRSKYKKYLHSILKKLYFIKLKGLKKGLKIK